MAIGKYFDTALGRLYVAAEGGCVVRLTCGTAAEGDVVADCEEAYRDGDSLKAVGGSSETSPGMGAGGYIDNNHKEDIGETLALLERAIGQVREYLDGKRTVFDIPIQASGTPFQKKAWDALHEIPYGQTRTYGEIAKAAGSPKGARAAGMACNRNPIMLLIPCHRVIGSTGKLVGFAGGLQMKKYLLKLEKERAES